MEGIHGVTAACTPCRRRWRTARDGDGPAGDLQPHILSTNTLTPTSEELLMKTCVSSSSACQTQRRCWTCGRSRAGLGDSKGHVLPVCGRVPTAAPCLTAPREHQPGTGIGPTLQTRPKELQNPSHSGISGRLRIGTAATGEQQHLLPLPTGENSTAVLTAAPRDA